MLNFVATSDAFTNGNKNVVPKNPKVNHPGNE